MLETAQNPLYHLENCINTILSSNDANCGQDGGEGGQEATHADRQRQRVQLRMNKKLKEGDLSLYIPSFRGHGGQQQQQQFIPEASDFASEITKQSSLKTYLTTCSSSTQAHFNIVLNRPAVFRDIVINVMTRGENYGNITNDKKPCFVVVTDMSSHCDNGSHGNEERLTLDQLRTVLIADHFRGVFAVDKEPTTCHMASAVQRAKSTDCNDASNSNKISILSIFSPTYTCTDVHSTDFSSELLIQTTEQCATAIKNCQFVTWGHTCSRFRTSREDKYISPGAGDGAECRPDGNSASPVQQRGLASGLGQFDDGCRMGVLEFEKLFAVHKDLQVGFDKNLIKSRVAISKGFLSSISRMELLAQQSVKQLGDGPCRMVHVCSCRSQFTTQQKGVAWSFTSRNVLAQNQLFLSHGLVSCRESGHKEQRVISAEDFLRLRQDQLTQSYLLKYGNVVQGPGWEDSIRQMAIATIKIEILSTALKNTVKLDVSGSSQEFREATFVMYNCARLHTLLQHFNDNVTKGIYPPLPPVDQVDFALLKDQVRSYKKLRPVRTRNAVAEAGAYARAEWELFMRYIVCYPSVVKEVTDSLGRTHGSLVTVHTSRISVFLLTFSHEFSSYYGRVHILGEPKAHLFPVMFARLYLTKSLQQVVQNCLKLLNIVPLTQM